MEIKLNPTPALFPTLLCLAVILLAYWPGTSRSGAAEAVARRANTTQTDAKDRERVLFRKALDEQRELVVVRGPRHPMAEVAPPIMSKNALKLRSVPKRGYFAVSLEIRPADGAPLVLATRIVEQWSETAFGPFQVYDVLLDDGLIVVAVSSGDIDLWRVAPFGDPRVKWPPIPPLPTPENAKLPIEFPQISTATLPGGDWSRVALASSRDATQVSLKLSLTGDGRVQADVVDLRVTPDNLAAGETPNTRFIQRGDEWRFDVPRK